MSTFEAELSLTATIIVARSRRVIFVTQAAHDVAVLDQVRSANCVQVRKPQLALLRLSVEFRQHANLDRTRLGENIVRMQKILVTVSKIEDRNAHRSIEIAVHLSNRTLELLPESLLLFLRGRCSDLRVGDSTRQQTNEHQDEGDVCSQSHWGQIFASRKRLTAVSDVTGE